MKCAVVNHHVERARGKGKREDVRGDPSNAAAETGLVSTGLSPHKGPRFVVHGRRQKPHPRRKHDECRPER
jgi:hypothetical protein